MELPYVWFAIVAFFWTGFFVLEGFDFGVGMLHRFVGRTDTDRRVAINAIGPFWDGNEVWLVVAGAAMFAAFPNWYASWFSALYLPLWLLLVALIVRGVSIEFRSKLDSAGWRTTWGWVLTLGSLVAPLLIGIGLGDMLVGLPIDAAGDFTGRFWELLTPYGVALGVTLVVLCLMHGAAFLTLRTTDAVQERSHSMLRAISIPAAVLVVAMSVWTALLAGHGGGGTFAAIVPAAAIVVATATTLLGRSPVVVFASTALAIGGLIVALFANLAPALMVSTTDPSFSLTITDSSASPYSLQVMTVVAAIAVPLVLAYQAWSYHVFRRRVSAPRPSPSLTAHRS